MTDINQDTIKHVANLANIPLQPDEIRQLTQAFQKTLKVVDELQQISVDDVEPTHQVTQISNVWRSDTIDRGQMLSQQQALANAPQTHQGYFVVPRILEK